MELMRVSTSILRSLYLPSYTACVKKGNTTAPIPEVSLPLEDGPVQVSVLEYRKRETAILDRYIAIKVGEELRKVESDLSEDSGGLDELFHRLQASHPHHDPMLIVTDKEAMRENRRSTLESPNVPHDTQHTSPVSIPGIPTPSFQYRNHPDPFLGSGNITFQTSLATW